ncbi:hypothetical protein [Nocardioides nematodiphilus]|uniref:hypothetical protein n=1 Tax=Nocardioides nematodiphilus TaxID=2849669 RepID=UPI001CD9372A|nr:hypothetical protein [Nocardioides nematodiphilus]MCA1984287.1 hypothetical protein [Nocardioides nematodiphilus]
MQLHSIEPTSAPRVFTGALSPEVFTVSALLSMPAVWTAVVEQALPFDVLTERFLIVLFTIALLAELIRRLGEGGALETDTRAMGNAVATTGAGAGLTATQLFDDAAYDADPYGADPLSTDGFSGFSDDFSSPLDAPLAGFGDDMDADSPLALGTGDDFGLGDLDAMDLAPLDLSADPFNDPV